MGSARDILCLGCGSFSLKFSVHRMSAEREFPLGRGRRAVRVVPTDENLMITRRTRNLLFREGG